MRLSKRSLFNGTHGALVSGLPTLLLQLIQQLVVLPAQLCPLGKLVLAARPRELQANREVFLLLPALIGKALGQRRREGEEDPP